MCSLRLPFILRRRRHDVILVVSIITLVCIFAIIPSSLVNASGAIGNGGTGSAGSGGAQSNKGWGWFNFSSSADATTTPAGFKTGGPWTTVSAICRASGADRVIAFINLRVYGTDAKTGVVYDYHSVYTGPPTFSHYNGNTGNGWIETSTAKSYYDLIPGDVDKSSYTWGSNVGWFCYDTTPNSDYSLTPSVQLSATVIEAGSSFDVKPAIINSGTTASDPVSLSLQKTITNPTAAGTTTNVSAAFPTGGPSPILVYTETSTDYPAGTNICYVLSVTPRSNSDSSTASSSPPACVVIGKKPKVQIWGGDLSVGRGSSTFSNVNTSFSVKSGRTFGSWVEYAIFAKGSVVGTASGSAYAGSQGMLTGQNYNTLSFSNKNPVTSNCPANTIGCYVNPQPVPDVAARFQTNPLTTVIPATVDLSAKQGLFTAGATLSISASNINTGQWVVINAPNSTVTITDNIKYTTATLHSISEIPQVIIIANKIIINDNVGQVDAWLIAKDSGVNPGTIQTCQIQPGSMKDCSNTLTVNGPVITNKLYLYRTAGSGTGVNSGDQAERFNLRADAYLWAYSHASSVNGVHSVYSTELPPRY